MSTPITPMRRAPCFHASDVHPVGDTQVVCGGLPSILNFGMWRGLTRRGSHTPNFTSVMMCLTPSAMNWSQPRQGMPVIGCRRVCQACS